MSFFFSSEQSSSSRRTSKPVAKLRQARGMRQDQTMMYQQETEQILRTERFLQQVEKATTNVKEYADAVANGADGETQEMANLVATMSMRAMNMSTKSLRKEGLTDALKLGKKKLSAFYRSNAAAYDGYEEAADLFEQFTAYLRNAMDGKPVPQLAVAIPDEPENEEEGNAMQFGVGSKPGDVSLVLLDGVSYFSMFFLPADEHVPLMHFVNQQPNKVLRGALFDLFVAASARDLLKHTFESIRLLEPHEQREVLVEVFRRTNCDVASIVRRLQIPLDPRNVGRVSEQYCSLLNKQPGLTALRLEQPSSEEQKNDDFLVGVPLDNLDVDRGTVDMRKCARVVLQEIDKAYDAGKINTKNKLVIFLHGFNNNSGYVKERVVSFDDVLGTRDVAVVAWNWLSWGNEAMYKPDQRFARTVAPRFAQFLQAFRSEGSRSLEISVIAHSMGNFVMVLAMETAMSAFQDCTIISGAPDVERGRYLEAVNMSAGIVESWTLYYNPNDSALWWSERFFVNNDYRAGKYWAESDQAYSIEVAVKQNDFENDESHGYIHSVEAVREDIKAIVVGGQTDPNTRHLQRKDRYITHGWELDFRQ